MSSTILSIFLSVAISLYYLSDHAKRDAEWIAKMAKNQVETAEQMQKMIEKMQAMEISLGMRKTDS